MPHHLALYHLNPTYLMPHHLDPPPRTFLCLQTQSWVPGRVTIQRYVGSTWWGAGSFVWAEGSGSWDMKTSEATLGSVSSSSSFGSMRLLCFWHAQVLWDPVGAPRGESCLPLGTDSA